MTFYIKQLFPKTYIYRDNKKFRIQARHKVLYYLIKDLGYKDGNNWDIPQEIIENSRFRKLWLRAFFDDEGSVLKNTVLGYNTNKKAIMTIKPMLELEYLKTKVYEKIPKNKNYKVCYTIRIPASSFLSFKKIGFSHTEKKKKYDEFCKQRLRQLGLSKKVLQP